MRFAVRARRWGPAVSNARLRAVGRRIVVATGRGRRRRKGEPRTAPGRLDFVTIGVA
jgi:hypothetical protein